jgi:hypothetical protein
LKHWINLADVLNNKEVEQSSNQINTKYKICLQDHGFIEFSIPEHAQGPGRTGVRVEIYHSSGVVSDFEFQKKTLTNEMCFLKKSHSSGMRFFHFKISSSNDSTADFSF